jgi:MYXO-CTERM domain-containing protein
VGATTTSVGDFTITLASVNPTLAVGGYPEDWTQITGTVSGLAAPVDGRVALRYFVTSGGPTGANSNIIAVDSFVYAPVPEPASWAMALAGLAGLAGWRRMRQG